MHLYKFHIEKNVILHFISTTHTKLSLQEAWGSQQRSHQPFPQRLCSAKPEPLHVSVNRSMKAGWCEWFRQANAKPTGCFCFFCLLLVMWMATNKWAQTSPKHSGLWIWNRRVDAVAAPGYQIPSRVWFKPFSPKMWSLMLEACFETWHGPIGSLADISFGVWSKDFCVPMHALLQRGNVSQVFLTQLRQ